MSKIKQIRENVQNATIVAATKYVGTKEMLKLLDEGICDFGENRVDSFLEKYEILKDNKNITWHFIGTLQTNKVKNLSYKANCTLDKYSVEFYNMKSNGEYELTSTKENVEYNTPVSLTSSSNGIGFAILIKPFSVFCRPSSSIKRSSKSFSPGLNPVYLISISVCGSSPERRIRLHAKL